MDKTEPFHRSIRSFVRRQSRMTVTMRQALITHATDYEVVPAAGQQLALTQLFGRQALRVLEIGFGNGDALIQMAQQHPQQDYLGVDVHRPGMANIFVRARELQLTNVRVICADAQEILARHIANDSFDRALIFFPDPWPKQRHHKRRLIQRPFIDLLVSKLCVGGQIHLATDWQDYAKQMLRVIDQHPQLKNLAGAGHYSEKPAYRPLTKYEQRGIRQGHGVYDLLYEKITSEE